MTGYGRPHRRARAELLAGNPACAWCRAAPATEADHVPPLGAFDNPREWVGRLVPSCKPCNASRGALFKANRNAPNPKQSRRW